jgi:MFS family permease
MERFGVSQVAATLGLTLFVAGYGEFQFPLSLLYCRTSNSSWNIALAMSANTWTILPLAELDNDNADFDIFGIGLGPMVWAPMSEIPQIGRNPIYIGTLVVFVFLQFAVIYAKNFGMLLAFRFLTGLFGSPVLATGGASLSDMYRPAKRGKFIHSFLLHFF